MSNERRKNITFDDRNSILQYAGFWFNGTWNASSVHQSGTLVSSNDPQANVTFNFPQPAVGFYYYGIPRSHGGFYAICIDCDSNAPRFEPVDAYNNTDNGANPPIVLFSRVFDTPGQHVVILTNQNDPRGTPPGNSQITIDRFDLEVIDDTPAVTITGSSNPESPTTTTPNSSTSSTPIGAIAGGAIGGFFAAVILLGLVFFCWLRRRKRRKDSREEAYDPPRNVDVEPYPTPFNQPKSSQITTNPSSHPVTSPTDTHPSSPYFSTVIDSYTTFSSSPPSSSTYTSSSNQSSSRRTRRERRREMDAGPVVEEDEGTLPPLYDQVFQNDRRNTVNRSSSGQERRFASGNNDHMTSIPLEPLSPVRREKS